MCLLTEEISIIMDFAEYHPRYFLNQLYYQKRFLPLFIDPQFHKDFHKKIKITSSTINMLSNKHSQILKFI